MNIGKCEGMIHQADDNHSKVVILTFVHVSLGNGCVMPNSLWHYCSDINATTQMTISEASESYFTGFIYTESLAFCTSAQ